MKNYKNHGILYREASISTLVEMREILHDYIKIQIMDICKETTFAEDWFSAFKD